MSRVHFGNAFQRWYALTKTERERLKADVKRGTPILSREALDHLCGLAVESGMKALMFKARLVAPDPSGDFPANASGRRPHVNELWDLFIAKARGRQLTSEWVRRLGGGGTNSPPNVFQTWRSEDRYAPDGTVSEATVEARLDMARRLEKIAQEEGLS